MATFSFDNYNKIITVESPTTSITVQELYNAIREYEDEPYSMNIPKIVNGSGKEVLSAIKSVGMTITLLDWKLKFADRAGPTWTHCDISGGNVVHYNSGLQQYETCLADTQGQYTTVSLELDTSAALLQGGAALTQDDLDNLADAVWDEALSGHVVSGTTGELMNMLDRLHVNKFTWDAVNSRFNLYNQSDALVGYLNVLDKDDASVVLQGTGPAQRSGRVELV